MISTLIAAIVLGQEPVTVRPAINEGPTKAKDYDWLKRHEEVKARVKEGNVDLVFIGDSITHGWNRELWQQYYGHRNAVNMGFGWDGTQHVLWRLQNGEFDGIQPKAAVVLIGVNNLGHVPVPDIALGVRRIVELIKGRSPKTKVLLLGVFPWKADPAAPNRQWVVDLNGHLKNIGGVTFLDIGNTFLDRGGRIPSDIMPDALHLTKKGYQYWAEAMEPTLSRLLEERNTR